MDSKHKTALVLGFFVTLAFYAIGWALTVDAIWNSVYDSANAAIRLIVVAS